MKKSALLLTAFLCLVSSFNNINAQSWQWANTSTGNDEDRGHDVAVDLNGNVYVTGYFDTSSITFGTFTLTNEGSDDFYLVKYDPSGNALWAVSNGGSGSEIGNSVACDSLGNVYVSGSYGSSQLLFGNDTLVNINSIDAFIAKYDPSGNAVWAMSIGGIGDEFGNDLRTDNNGHLFATGRFTSPTLMFDTTTLTATGTSKIYLVKYDLDGNVIWARGTGGPSFDQKSIVNFDNTGNVYLAGDYYEYSLIVGTDTFPNAGLEDIYVVKYDMNGNIIWSTTWGGFNNDKVTGVEIDANGDIYLSGYYYSPFIGFGSFTLNNSGFGAWDLYMIKLDANATVTRAYSLTNNTENDEITGMSFVNNYLYVTGWYQDSITLGSTTIHSNGSFDVFVSKFDTTFTPLWTISTGGTMGDVTTAIATDVSGNSYITGFYESPSISFGSSTIMDNVTGWDSYVAKLVESGTSVREFSLSNFNIYPNPSNGIFHLENVDADSKIYIISESGECVYENLFNNSNIDLSRISKGIYFICLTDKMDRTRLERLVIE